VFEDCVESSRSSVRWFCDEWLLFHSLYRNIDLDDIWLVELFA